ncbi:MAG: hypothetical protein HQK55_01090 [Deltaproteobacteria bacterium]|nr:hypothetical protein [Deltaproteobacteria bacterium]
MKNLSKVVFVALLVLFLVPVGASAAGKQIQKIDLGKMTCGEFLQEAGADSSGETAAYMLMWLDGFLSGVSGDTVLDGKQFEEFSKNIAAHCAKNPTANLLAASKELGLAK